MSIIKIATGQGKGSGRTARIFTIDITDELGFVCNYVVRLIRYEKVRRNVIVISGFEFAPNDKVFNQWCKVINADNNVLGKVRFQAISKQLLESSKILTHNNF